MNFYIGLTMLMLAILEGFAGYSLIDDMLSGMGLAIARAVLEAHGGTIGVVSQLGRGSVFSFSLPLEKAANPGATAEPAALRHFEELARNRLGGG